LARKHSLGLWVDVEVGLVVLEEVELDHVVARPVQAGLGMPPRVGADQAHVRYTVLVLSAGRLQCQALSRGRLGLRARVFRIGHEGFPECLDEALCIGVPALGGWFAKLHPNKGYRVGVGADSGPVAAGG